MPMLTKIEITNNAVMLVRTFLNQSSQGSRPLQMFMVQLAHQYGPNARYQNAARSCGLPLNHATKFSVTYEKLTMEPVSRHSFARFSKWCSVMISSRWNSLRIGTSRVITIATSHDTTLCTDSTSGVARAAR